MGAGSDFLVFDLDLELERVFELLVATLLTLDGVGVDLTADAFLERIFARSASVRVYSYPPSCPMTSTELIVDVVLIVIGPIPALSPVAPLESEVFIVVFSLPGAPL